MTSPTPAASEMSAEQALQVCHRVLTFDLRKMIGKDSPDYNQAVRDALDNDLLKVGPGGWHVLTDAARALLAKETPDA